MPSLTNLSGSAGTTTRCTARSTCYTLSTGSESPILHRVVNSCLDEVFAALADPTRRAMLSELAGGARTVGELAAPHSMTLPAISKHLTVLRRAGLITQRRAGRMQICALAPGPLREATVWLQRHQQFWTERIDSLERFLETS